MEQNFDDLEYRILQQTSKTNHPLGSSTLSIELGVPPATIGRALQSLEHRGFLTKVSNKGRCITLSGVDYLNEMRTSLSLEHSAAELIRVSSENDKKPLIDVLLARKLLERETAYLAAQRIEDQQIEELTDILDRQEYKVRSGLLGESEDLEFHTLIAQIAGNDVIERILKLILVTNNVYRTFSYLRQKVVARSNSNHRTILAAIANKDPDQAAKAMFIHLQLLIDDIEQHYTKQSVACQEWDGGKGI